MVDDTRDLEERACALFLDRARERTGEELPGGAVPKRVPALVRERVVERVSRFGGAELDADDAVQEVLLRLVQRPPTHEPSKSARQTVLAWVRTTTTNLLTDAFRRATTKYEDGSSVRKRKEGVDVNQVTGTRSYDTARELARYETVDEIRAIERWLDEHYPKGARYVRARRENPDAGGAELAEMLGVSRANLDQIAKRTRDAVRNRCATASREQGR
ncbi:MAG: sigma factor [Polyangia bacterium]